MRSPPRTRRAGVALVSVFTLCWGAAAHAQPADLAAAEALFEQGRRALAAGNLDEACPKFAESHRLAPAAGAALNLGDCYEKQQKIASAWGAFQEALALSTATGQADRAQIARGRAAAVEPRLSRLVVTVPPASEAPGLEVRRDGVLMPRAQWGVPIPVDKGSHVIEASAKDKQSFRKTIEIAAERSTSSLVVPALEDEARAPAAVEPPPAAPAASGGSDGSTLRIVGIATAVLGAGLIGTGVFFGLQSSSKKDDLESQSHDRGVWGPDQRATYDDGESAATIANVLFVTGAVVLVAGGVLTVLGFTKRASTTAVVDRGAGLRCTF